MAVLTRTPDAFLSNRVNGWSWVTVTKASWTCCSETDLASAVEDDLGDVDAAQGTVGVKDHADEVSGLPVIALLDVLKDREHGGPDDLGILRIGAFARHVAEDVSPVSLNTVVMPTWPLRGLDAAS